MRVLFVSGTIDGGSGRSQRQLGNALLNRGHEVRYLVDDGRRASVARGLHEFSSDLAAKLRGRCGGSVVTWVQRLPGRRVRSQKIDGLTHLCTAVPENAAVGAFDVFRPELVVGSSILRPAWRQIKALSDERCIPTILYLREDTALGHLKGVPHPADAVVANSDSLRRGALTLGMACELIPSVIDTTATRVESSRTVVLLINPIATHGAALIADLARALPYLSFVVQESWPLSREQEEWVRDHLIPLPNIAFRRRQPAGPALYHDARVLVVPHRIDNRPRVIVEAQANGIPVLVSNLPGLVEAMGSGGIALPDEDVRAWKSALERMFADDEYYGSLSTAALHNSQRLDIQAEGVAERFEALALRVVGAAHPGDTLS